MFDFNRHIADPATKPVDFTVLLKQVNEDFNFGELAIDDNTSDDVNIMEESDLLYFRNILQSDGDRSSYKTRTELAVRVRNHRDEIKEMGVGNILAKFLKSGGSFLYAGDNNSLSVPHVVQDYYKFNKLPKHILQLDMQNIELTAFNEAELAFFIEAYVGADLAWVNPEQADNKTIENSIFFLTDTPFWNSFNQEIPNRPVYLADYSNDNGPDMPKAIYDELINVQKNQMESFSRFERVADKKDKAELYRAMYSKERPMFTPEQIDETVNKLVYRRYEDGAMTETIDKFLFLEATRKINDMFRSMTLPDLEEGLKIFSEMIKAFEADPEDYGNWNDAYVTHLGSDDMLDEWMEKPENAKKCSLPAAIFCYVVCNQDDKYSVDIVGKFDIRYESSDWEVGYPGGWDIDGGCDTVKFYGFLPDNKPLEFDVNNFPVFCDLYYKQFDVDDFDGSDYSDPYDYDDR